VEPVRVSLVRQEEPGARRARGTPWLGRLLGRSLGTETRAQATVVAVASGKGGTGKTFLTTNLAVALADRGTPVAVADCDFGLGNAHLMMGMNPRLTMQHVLGGEVTMREACVGTVFGATLIAGGSGISRLADLDEGQFLKFARGLTEVAADHATVLLDTAAGISPQCLLTLMVADHIVLVTNPEIAALTDAYALVKCLSRQPVQPPISVVVNRVTAVDQGHPTWEKLADVSRRFAGYELHYLGAIPDEPAVTHRRLGQAPLLVGRPECAASVSIREILMRLEEASDGLRSRQVSGLGRIDVRLRKIMTGTS
jgi:flagellar biosynthesis protein FlhG